MGACTHGRERKITTPKWVAQDLFRYDGLNVSTYLALNIHIIFSTKNRTPFLTDGLLDQLLRYIVGTIVGLGAVSIKVGGVADHVHILVRIKSTQNVSNFVQELKKSSSHWMRERVPSFAWQDGYAAIAVSPSDLNMISNYILNQAEHHHEVTFEEERLEILKLAAIDYDPRYLD